MIEIIIGPARSGKTSYCYNQIEEELKKEEHSRLIVLVPDQANLQIEDELANRFKPGLLRVEIMSFQRFAHHILTEVDGQNIKVIDDLERIMILKKLLDKHKNELKYFKKADRNEGFMDEMNRLLTMFEQNHIDDGVMQELVKAENIGEVFKCKMDDMAQIQKWFETYIQGRFETIEKTLEKLAKNIHKSKKLEGAKLWVDGFYGFTETQIDILIALISKVTDFTITLPMDKLYTKDEFVLQTNPFYDSIKTYQRIQEIIKESHLEQYLKPIQWVHAEEEENYKALDYLKQYYLQSFAPPYTEVQDEIQIKTYSTKEEEVEETAKKIRQLVRDSGYRYKDIGVLVGEIGAYQSSIVSIFNAYNLPLFIDKKRKIHTNSLVAFIQSTLEVLTSRWRYKSMMTLIRLDMFGFDREKVDILDNYILACGIQSESQWEQCWEREIEEGTIDILNEMRQQIFMTITSFKVALKEEKERKKYLTIKDITIALYNYLMKCDVKSVLDKRIEQYELLGEGMLLQENKGIWGQVIDVLERLVDLLGDEVTTLAEYRGILKISFEHIKMGIIPPSKDQVTIGTVERSRLPQMKAVFVLGVAEGVIPLKNDGMALFSEMDKLVLQQIDKTSKRVKVLTDVLVHKPLYENQFLIYTAITRANEKLYISTVKRDELGKSVQPSLVYYKLDKMFKSIEDAKDVLDGVTTPVATLSYIGQNLRKYISVDKSLPSDSIWKDVLSWYYEQTEWKHKITHLINDLAYTPQQHHLKKENAELLYPNGLETNISQLEAYRHCPCCYFIKYGIKVSERKMFKWNEADLGKLFHATLEQYPKELDKEKTTWTKASPKQLDECVERAVVHSVETVMTAGKQDGARRYIVSKLTTMSKRAINALTYQLKQGDFEPAEYEVNFGMAGLPAIEIDLEDGRTIRLKGQIDRVDLYIQDEDNRFIKIIDYKSGQKDFSLLEVYHALQLQLLLYLDAFIRLNKANQPAGMFYFKIESKKISYQLGMTDEDVENQQLKQYQLSGLVLNDLDIIRHMEHSVNGEVIPVKLKKDGTLTATSSVATKEQFEELRMFMTNKIKQIGTDMLNGRISAKPYKFKTQEGCSYCKYGAICQFDTSCQEHQYEQLDTIPSKKLWEEIQKKNTSDNKGDM
ncbi:MAG: PD-(D/E)XK nuclease family protein [Cellulosilyticaceae bacterium]